MTGAQMHADDERLGPWQWDGDCRRCLATIEIHAGGMPPATEEDALCDDCAHLELDDARAENDRLRRALAIAEETRNSAQAASTRDILDARNMRRIVNAPPYEAKALADVSWERRLADAEHGAVEKRLHVPMGTGLEFDGLAAAMARQACDDAFAAGKGTWRHILTEECLEAIAESDPVKLRAELIQTAAVCVAMVEVLDRLAAGEKSC